MPAYIIAQINVTNPDKYREYARLAAPATQKYGGSVEYQAARERRLGAADFNMMVVEGAQP